VAGPRTRVLYTAATSIVLAGIPLVAAGILLSRELEMPAAVLLGLAMLGLSSLLVVAGVRRLASPGKGSTGALLVAAGGALVVSMSFAVLFTTTGSATRGADAPLVPYATMVAVHGVANAGGFAACALLAFSIAPPPRRSGPYGGTWPLLFGRGFIGPDFYERRGAVDASRTVAGQIGSLGMFAHRSFSPPKVHSTVRDFYERTATYELQVVPHWYFPFVTGGRLFAWFARRFLGQLELPTSPTSDETVSTRLFGVRGELDGRAEPRGYVRAYGAGDSLRANYVASYSTHRAPDRLLLSCSFPLPFSALVGVLRFDDGPRPGGLVVTSRTREGEGPADEGLFLATPWGPLRLPCDERIEVWAEESGAPLRARHTLHVCGLKAFTLEYEGRKISAQS
jgi:hypothetical protein